MLFSRYSESFLLVWKAARLSVLASLEALLFLLCAEEDTRLYPRALEKNFFAGWREEQGDRPLCCLGSFVLAMYYLVFPGLPDFRSIDLVYGKCTRKVLSRR